MTKVWLWLLLCIIIVSGWRWGRAGGCGGSSCSRSRCGRCCPPPSSPGMNFGMSLLLIGSGKPSAADITSERFLPGMRPDVSGEVIGSWKGAHTDATLKGFLTRVDTDVTCQLVGAGKPPVTVGNRAGVRPLVQGRLAGPVRVLARSYRHESYGHRALLINLKGLGRIYSKQLLIAWKKILLTSKKRVAAPTDLFWVNALKFMPRKLYENPYLWQYFVAFGGTLVIICQSGLLCRLLLLLLDLTSVSAVSWTCCSW